jgi:lipopolysaccharide export system permease protein
MPVFWWYLLKNYLRVFLLCVVSFIAILLVVRLEEIAQFATIGAKPSYIFFFTLYQIPYILPIAIPISCLISAWILFQRLSHTHELTALRAGGLGLHTLTAPILIAGAFLGLTTFYIASEMATASHLATRKMVYDLTSVNPLVLLQSAKIAKLKNAFVQMDPIRNGQEAQDLVIAVNDSSGKRLNVCLAKRLELSGKDLMAKQVSLISCAPSLAKWDHLIIENQKNMSSEAPQFAFLLRKAGWKIANDHLKFSLLRARMAHLRSENHQEPKTLRVLHKCQTEMIRRLSVGLCAFTFTLVGIAFGMEISRNGSKRAIFCVLLLTALSLISFCIAKELGHRFILASALFLMPHVVMIGVSSWTLSRLNRGIE